MTEIEIRQGARGEGVIELPDGEEVSILYTNRALADVEKATGQSIILVADGFANGRTGIREMAQVLRAGMEAHRRDARAGGRAVTLNDAFDILDAVGFARVAEVAMTAVGEVLGYGVDEGDLDDPNL
jgi:hypothetical protein